MQLLSDNCADVAPVDCQMGEEPGRLPSQHLPTVPQQFRAQDCAASGRVAGDGVRLSCRSHGKSWMQQLSVEVDRMCQQ